MCTTSAGAVRLPDGSFVQTTVVPWLGGEFGTRAAAAGIFAWGSNDTLRWSFVGTVATAAQFPGSGEGPNEHSLALLADGSLLVVLRMDGGDGLRWGDHRTKNYHSSRSLDCARSWSRPVEMRDAGGRGMGCGGGGGGGLSAAAHPARP